MMDLTSLKQTTADCSGSYGLGHSSRLIELVRRIAEAEGIAYDADAVAFAAYVHDLGASARYQAEGVDHAVRSVEILPEFFAMCAISGGREALIKQIVLNHHSPTPPPSVEALLFRDADAIDFLGAMGVARDFSRFSRDMKKGVAAIRRHRAQLPGILHFESSKRLAGPRIEEMDAFMAGFEEECLGCDI